MNNCVLWTKSISNTGYGQTWYKGKTISAHRWSWIISRGEIPKGMFVLHKCDVKHCINVNHLYLGTRLDNARDMVKRGQIAKGERHGMYTHPENRQHGTKSVTSKLTEEQVQEIRALFPKKVYLKDVAEKYGVSTSAISRIVRGETYNSPMLKQREAK